MSGTVASIFAGVGGFDLAAERAGFRVAWQCEIDAHARGVLRHRWPHVPCYRDVRHIGRSGVLLHDEPAATTQELVRRVDLVCAGWPCQDLSVAGRRAGLAGRRSGLFRELVRVVDDVRPRWLLLENVPGLLSSNGGRDAWRVLRAIAGLGYGFAWRVLDARYYGVAQRRRRVLIVGCARGAMRRAAAVLLEPRCVCGDSAKSAEARAHVAGTLTARTGGGGLGDADIRSGQLVAGTLSANLIAYQCHGSNGPAGTLRAGNGNETGGVPFVAATITAGGERAGRRYHDDDNVVVANAITAREGSTYSNGGKNPKPRNVVATFDPSQVTNPHHRARALPGTPAETLHARAAALYGEGVGVRRLTPRECERLQGFPDDWTLHAQREGGETFGANRLDAQRQSRSGARHVDRTAPAGAVGVAAGIIGPAAGVLGTRVGAVLDPVRHVPCRLAVLDRRLAIGPDDLPRFAHPKMIADGAIAADRARGGWLATIPPAPFLRVVVRLLSITEYEARAEGLRTLRELRDGGHLAVDPHIDALDRYPVELARGTNAALVVTVPTAREAYLDRWDRINERRGWPAISNPWVWVVTFSVVRAAQAVTP